MASAVAASAAAQSSAFDTGPMVPSIRRAWAALAMTTPVTIPV